MILIITALFGYLLGSIPFGLLLTRAAGLGDIRAIGSGNIGATNVLRTGNKKLALATLLLDGGKGAAAVLITQVWAGYANLVILIARIASHCINAGDPTFHGYNPALWPLIAGLAAVIGHMFPVWLKFKGGKGVATALGTMIALAPWVGIGACLIWLAAAFAFR